MKESICIFHRSACNDDVPYMEDGKENEEGVDDEGEDVGKGSEGERHGQQQEERGQEEGVGGDVPVVEELVCCCCSVCCSVAAVNLRGFGLAPALLMIEMELKLPRDTYLYFQ